MPGLLPHRPTRRQSGSHQQRSALAGLCATLDTQLVNQQLSEALASRIVIEQAKGMIAERHGRPVDAAFAAIRHHTRGHNQRLAEVARGVVSGTTDLDVLPPPPP